jgi:hypothetical protein
MLYNALSTCDWSSLYKERSVDADTGRLNVAVIQAIHLTVPSRYIKNHKHPPWFHGKLKFYIKNIL